MTDTALSDRWFVTAVPRPAAAIRLACLPSAGGGAGGFAAWGTMLGDAVEIHALALPGRERRIEEPPGFDVADVANAVAARVAGHRFALYGHSMGGLLAYEVAVALRRAGAPGPAHLFVAAARPPDARDPLAEAVTLDDETLLSQVAALGGMPAEVLAEPEMREIILGPLRADLGWLHRYRPHPEPPLDVPVTGFAGVDDPNADPTLMRGWSRYTTGAFELETLAGGHFFTPAGVRRIAEKIRDGVA
jgi:surfactin synthase thioesterase subunit